MFTTVDLRSGGMFGGAIQESSRRLSDMTAIFRDSQAARAMPDQLMYSVQYFLPVAEGAEGGLFWGNTTVQPGKVGDEYFMTKGHFHRIRNRGEFYLTAEGEGALLLMDETGTTRVEFMSAGSLHYIPGETAHRVANIGTSKLTFLACWPSDAGHDYETIERNGFSARLVERDGKPQLVGRNGQ